MYKGSLAKLATVLITLQDHNFSAAHRTTLIYASFVQTQYPLTIVKAQYVFHQKVNGHLVTHVQSSAKPKLKKNIIFSHMKPRGSPMAVTCE